MSSKLRHVTTKTSKAFLGMQRSARIWTATFAVEHIVMYIALPGVIVRL